MKTAILIMVSFLTLSQPQSNLFTKDEVKAIKKKLPANLIMKADYVDQKIWIKTKKIGFMGNVDEKYHQFYFLLKKDSEGNWMVGPMRWKFVWKLSDWLFLKEILIVTAKTNNETRQGSGNRYEIIIPDDEQELKINYDITVTEGFDMVASSKVMSWLNDVAVNGYFTRFRFKGNTSYLDGVLRAKDLQKHAQAILDARKICLSL